MSGHVGVSHSLIPIIDVPADQPAADVAVSTLSSATTAWQSVLVTNLVTHRQHQAERQSAGGSGQNQQPGVCYRRGGVTGVTGDLAPAIAARPDSPQTASAPTSLRNRRYQPGYPHPLTCARSQI